MKLIYTGTKKEVKVGDKVVIRSGDEMEAVMVKRITKPHKPSSTGRVLVAGDLNSMEFFPTVIGAEWIEREDR